jgi:hypothetical protein
VAGRDSLNYNTAPAPAPHLGKGITGLRSLSSSRSLSWPLRTPPPPILRLEKQPLRQKRNTNANSAIVPSAAASTAAGMSDRVSLIFFRGGLLRGADVYR